MADWVTSITYLEKSIRAMSFATEEGRAMARAGDQAGCLEIGIRGADRESRAQWEKVAAPLATCGVSDVEQRAKRILDLLGTGSLDA